MESLTSVLKSVSESQPDVIRRYALPIAAAGVISATVYWAAYRYVHKYRNTFRDMGIPYVKPDSWIGMWKQYFESGDFFQVEMDLVRENGQMFGVFEGRNPVLYVSDPDLIRQVFLKDFDSFVDRRSLAPIRSRAIDFALSTLTGPRWKHVRQQVTPAFTPAALKRMTPLILHSVEQFTSNLAKKAEANEAFDAKFVTGCYTMDVIASVAFGMELDSLNHPDNPFVTNARAVFSTRSDKGGLNFMIKTILLFPFLVHVIVNLVMHSKSSLMKPFFFFQEVVENEMKRRREANNKVERPDFLQMVMHLEKDPKSPELKDFVEWDEFGLPWLRNGLTHEEIVGQAMLFFVAGYETTANALTFALLELAKNPHIQAKLYEEVEAKLPDGQQPTMEAVHELTYLEMCVNETLRMYTSLTRIERACTRDTHLGGVAIPKGFTVVIPVNTIHNDPNLWTEPDRFDPERFADADEISPLRFFPFGMGNRNCIGMRLALLELKLALVCLVRQFEFSVSPQTQLPLKWRPHPLRSTLDPIYLQVKKRRQ